MPKRYANMQARILANSRVNPRHEWDGVPCRDWTGSTFPNGYGRIGVRFKSGPRKGKGKSTGAHRESHKAFKPFLMVGSKNVVRHCCNRPICVEPKHLMGGIQKQNVRQCVKEGRHKTPFRRKGERYASKVAT